MYGENSNKKQKKQCRDSQKKGKKGGKNLQEIKVEVANSEE